MSPRKHLPLHNTRKRLFQIVEVGYVEDFWSRSYDILNVAAIVLNLVASILLTFSELPQAGQRAALALEGITVAFFAFDYGCRILTASFLYPEIPRWKAVLKYVFSFTGIVDLLSFLPYYLPFFFPAGAVAFRMFRIVRIFRLFRINAYYDSLNVIVEVLKRRQQQLISSLFILTVLILGASLCMYSIEHAAQPDIFKNALSGIWWAVSTLLTVGYGDIYPITTAGRILGIIITFLGVGVVAIPTGIISAGFVEQYTRLKESSEEEKDLDLHFIKVLLTKKDAWTGKAICDLVIPENMIVAAVVRGPEILVPRGEVVVRAGDALILAAETYTDKWGVDLREIELLAHHPWNGTCIRDLDISRQTFVVIIKRGDHLLIPRDDTRLLAGDRIILYTKKRLSEAVTVDL